MNIPIEYIAGGLCWVVLMVYFVTHYRFIKD